MIKESMLPTHTRELFIYRIINRFIRYKELKIVSPSQECLYDAQQLYCDIYNEAIEYEILTEKEIVEWMIERGEWSEYDNNQLTKVIPNHIEYFLKEVYHNIGNKKQLKQIYVPFNIARKSLTDLFNKKNIYSHLTAEGLALFSKFQYIIEKTTLKDGRLYDWANYSIYDIMSYIYSSHIEESVIRSIARNSPWIDIWNASKKTSCLFDGPSTNFTDEQLRLIKWSSLYDNISELPDCPIDKVIENDDALDGWFLIKKEEREKERNLNKAEDIAGVNKGAQEVFLVTRQDEDESDTRLTREQIYNLNDPSSRAIIKNRFETIKKKGEAQDIDFSDVQRDLYIKHTKNSVGGNRG